MIKKSIGGIKCLWYKIFGYIGYMDMFVCYGMLNFNLMRVFFINSYDYNLRKYSYVKAP